MVTYTFMTIRQLISIVTPCYNEESNVTNHFERVKSAISSFRKKYDFEFIYTDNCSTDNTFQILKSLSSQHERVRILRFSRNIGAARAMMLGLEHSKGDASILIQADLQDPPELIPLFIQGWESGSDVVYGKIEQRFENVVMRILRRIYYKVVTKLSDVPIPENVGDFRLTSRRVLNSLSHYHEYDLYLRGAIAHIGYPQMAVPYVREARAGGRSSAGLPYLFSFALNGMISTTVVPIRAVILIGLITSGTGLLFTIGYIASRFIFPSAAPHGFTTLVSLVTFFAGCQMLALGIIGEYIRKIYIESLGRPRGFIQDRIGFDA